eukprot:scaffold37235_cov63-Phaeocystis_antarctica.AAC.4
MSLAALADSSIFTGSCSQSWRAQWQAYARADRARSLGGLRRSQLCAYAKGPARTAPPRDATLPPATIAAAGLYARSSRRVPSL